MKIKDKVRLLRKNENGQWNECGVGVVKALHTNKAGEDAYISYWDKDWKENLNYSEIIPINAECMKVVKF